MSTIDNAGMASVTLSLDPADAYWVSLEVRDANNRVVDSVEGATSAYDATLDLAPGRYTAVETFYRNDGSVMRVSREPINVAAPTPPKPRCEVRNWFVAPPPPPPPSPKLSHRCEVADWF